MKSFAEQLKGLGYEVTQNGDRISFPFKIETGKLAGEEITLGFVANADFVLNPPSGPHVRPQLLPIHPQEAPHPVGGVHESPFGTKLAGTPPTIWPTSTDFLRRYEGLFLI